MNTKYGKLVDGQVVYAPNTLDTEDGKKMNPSEASYLAAGWKKVVDEPPAPAPVGKRIFSKLKLVAALKAADKWVLVKTWLEEKAYYDYYLAAQDFAEDNDLFIEGRNAIQGYLGVSDEYIESILSKCVAD